MVTVKVLGTGCKKCETLFKRVEELIKDKRLDAAVEKVTDINTMVDYGIMMTPGLVINEKVVSTGIIPKNEQIISWIEGV